MPFLKSAAPPAIVPSHRVEPVDGGEAVVAPVVGEIDLHNSPDLRRALLDLVEANKPKKLVLNFAAVDYLDSSAIAVLVEAHKALRPIGGKLYLTDLQPRVRGIFEIARLDAIFGLPATEAEALSA